MNRKAAVLVAGSWGTALAAVLADNNFDVTLWARNTAQVEEINTKHTNSKALQDAILPDNISATSDIGRALTGAEIVLFAAPSSAMRDVAKLAAPFIAA